MPMIEVIQSLSVALGIGLMMGAERERRKSTRTAPMAAGIRTFAMASVSGALAMQLGGVPLLAVLLASVALYTALSYWRSRDDDDPGLTTEIALMIAVLLGAKSLSAPTLAGGLAVVVTVLLAVRQQLQDLGDLQPKVD